MKLRLRSADSLRALRRQQWQQKWERTSEFPWQVTEVAPELERAVESGWLPAGATVLDIGCGDGLNAAWLARGGYRVHGIDFAEAAIGRARETYGQVPGLSFEVADVCRRGTLAGRTFEALVDRGCLHNISARLRADYAANVASWAAPGAPFLLSMISRDEGDEGLDRRRSVEALLGDAFRFEEVTSTDSMATFDGVAKSGVVFHLRRR